MLYRALSVRSFLPDGAGKSGFFQSCQHFFGVVPVGEGPHLHPEQAVPLGLGGGLLRLGRDIGSPQILTQAPGDGLAYLRGMLDDPAGRFRVVVKFALHIGGGGRRGPHLVQPGIGLDILRGTRGQRGQLRKHRLAGIVPFSGHGEAEQPGAADLPIEGVGVDAIVDIRPECVGFGASLGHAGSEFRQLHLHAAAAQGGGLRLGDLLALGVLVGAAPGVFVFRLVAGTDINSFGHFDPPSPFMICAGMARGLRVNGGGHMGPALRE